MCWNGNGRVTASLCKVSCSPAKVTPADKPARRWCSCLRRSSGEEHCWTERDTWRCSQTWVSVNARGSYYDKNNMHVNTKVEQLKNCGIVKCAMVQASSTVMY